MLSTGVDSGNSSFNRMDYNPSGLFKQELHHLSFDKMGQLFVLVIWLGALVSPAAPISCSIISPLSVDAMSCFEGFLEEVYAPVSSRNISTLLCFFISHLIVKNYAKRRSKRRYPGLNSSIASFGFPFFIVRHVSTGLILK